ncbi:NADH-quinone oxidoreductase subunit F [Vibrio sp. SM6]|uniref:NADH-quinone oxidoreductase subunit F n=2 Tax=Vibrio agarilyticus TaxID=2726741 RepID=A0A7X8TU29_9VIBR|nr:NADH-quinone oxidoreductase subunit F [Vibrio agarilyticus]
MTQQSSGVWKQGQRGGRSTPKGRQLDEHVMAALQTLLADMPKRRDLLIEYLHRIQDKHGHISAAYVRALAQYLVIPEVEVFEVASFYAHFDVVKESQTPPPEVTIRVCNSLSCQLAGADSVAKALSDHFPPHAVRVKRAPCMGRCFAAPTVAVGKHYIDNADVNTVDSAIQQRDFEPHLPNYQTFEQYTAGGGYQIYRNLLSGKITIETLQAEVEQADIRGMGGAGFPSFKKWQFVQAEPAPRFMAVNGDEGEPGTFKDRFYLETEPHLVLEGMLIAAFAVEAQRIYFYLRDEYPAAHEILRIELEKLIADGMVAPDYIELRRGAGAYICGEESAMLESIEGKRGLPRHRPPFVAQKGIFNRPTLVHNIETLYWVARTSREGPEVRTRVTKHGRRGLRGYSISGRVKNPGMYQLPEGTTVLELIDAAGGMLDGHTFSAYQPGGPSSGLLPASIDDVPLDFDTLQPFGTFIGSAAVVILSQHDSVRDAAVNMLEFFADESCGQCTPCRVGCEKALQLMQQPKWDKALLNELGEVMRDASICGLGQAAPNPFQLVIKYFDDEV